MNSQARLTFSSRADARLFIWINAIRMALTGKPEPLARRFLSQRPPAVPPGAAAAQSETARSLRDECAGAIDRKSLRATQRKAQHAFRRSSVRVPGDPQ